METHATKISERLGLVSVMNRTKWTELLDQLNEIQCQQRVKYIDSEQPSNWQNGAWMPVPNYVEFSGGPVKLVYVEWLEIQKQAYGFGAYASGALTDRSDSIRQILTEHNATFTETEGTFVIYGHTRSSQNRPAEQGGADQPAAAAK